MSRFTRTGRLPALVIALSLVALPAVAQEARLNGHGKGRLTLEQVSPEKTLLFASFAGIEQCSKAADDLGLYRFFAEDDTQKFLAPLIARYHEAAAQTPPEFQRHWDMMKAVGSGRVAFGVMGITWSKESSIPVLPAAILAIDVGSAREEAAGLIGKALEEFGPMLDEQGITREVKPFKGIDVNVFKMSIDGFNVAACYAFLDNLLLVSIGQGPIRRAINLSQRPDAKTLANSELFNRCRRKSKGHTLVEFFVGIDPLIKRTKLFIPDAIEAQIDKVGLGDLGALYMASSVNDGDTFDTIYLDAPAPRRGLLALDNGKPLSPATLRMIPADAIAFAGFRCDLAKAFDTVWGSFEEVANEEMMEEARRWLRRAQDEIGLDIREDILGAIGQEMVIYAAMPRDLRIPKIVASLGVRNRDKAAKLINLLLQSAPFQFRDLRHGGHTIKMMAPRQGMNAVGSPCFALLDDRLLISPTRSGMEQALDRLGDGNARGIAVSQNFRDSMNGIPWKHASALGWIDTKRVLALGYEAAYDALPGMATPEIPVDVAHMPKLDTFLRHTRSLGGAVYGDEDGIVLQVRSLGVASILAACGRFIERSPGAAPYAIEQMVGSFQRSFSGGGRSGAHVESRPRRASASASGSSASSGTAEVGPADTNIVNPLKKGDPEYERLLAQVAERKEAVKEFPNSGRAHFNLASACHRVGQFEAALVHFMKAVELGHNVPTATYNTACTLSLLNRKEEAVKWLAKALNSGFQARGFLERDSDLDNIRDTKGFKELLKKSRSR